MKKSISHKIFLDFLKNCVILNECGTTNDQNVIKKAKNMISE